MIKLRHSIRPYVSMGIITLIMVPAALSAISIRTRQWEPILSAGPIFVALFAALVALGLRYRVYYSDSVVQIVASGAPMVSIPFSRITRVENEVSVESGRPFRRIAIYAGKGHPGSHRIDVSLKHFQDEDIQTLIEVLRKNRPDLAIPNIYNDKA